MQRLQRKRGACVQCARKKRKCDHKWPQCTQCLKHGQMCQLQNFKVSTPTIAHRDKSINSAAPKTQSSRAARVGQGSPVLTDASAPPVSHQEDGATGMPSADLITGMAIDQDFGDSGALTSLLRSPRSEATFENPGFLSPDPTSTAGVLATSNHVALADVMTNQDTAEVIEMGNEPFMDLLPLGIDDIALGTGTSTDTIPNGDELLVLPRAGDAMLPFKPYDLTLDHVYCPMPWPSDMLASSDRRFLWQYFLRIAETDFLCLDWEEVGHLYGFQHPYITTLPQMALANDALRAAVFCFTASQYRLRHGGREFERTKAVAGTEAAMALSRQIAQDTDDSNLLSMISAATLLHYFGTQRGDYLRVASRLVSKYLARPKAGGRSSTTSFPEVPLTEFRWSVISTLCSLSQPSAPLGTDVCRMIEMSQDEIEQNYSLAFQHWVSHPIYTFSPRLVNPLLRIGRLLETQLLQLDSTDPPTEPTWASQVSEAEDMLLEARDLDMKVATSMLGSADPGPVLALNESMYAAGAILVYARAHGLPPTAPFIRRQTQIVFEEIAKIPINSHVSFSIVFPLFIAGCEAVEQQMRDSIVERLREPGGVTYDRGDIGGALHHIWAIRDMEPGLPWPQWVKKMEPRYRLSCLM